jgi:uncharacterized protein (DUF58 family)
MRAVQNPKTRFWQEPLLRWIDRRHPLANSHRLHRKNLYIFPSLTGMAYLFLSLIVWLLGTNYQNNLILALAYMQVSVFVLTILNTYHNLAGLQLQLLGAEPGFVGEKITFHLLFNTANAHGGHYVTVQWQHETPVIFDFEPGQEHREKIYAQATVRGWLRPQRLLIKSTFPMGLLRCWTWLKFDAAALVYPAPVLAEMPSGIALGEEEQGRHAMLQKGDEFLGFRAYRPGDSLKHVAWKQYARDQGLLSKEYGELTSSLVWLQWQDFYKGDVELCLSQLSFWASRLIEQQKEFGLRLPDQEISPAAGPEHLARVLRSLALFEGAV